MKPSTTTAALAALLAMTAACAQAGTAQPQARTTAVAAQSEIKVDPGDRNTTITGADGETFRLPGKFEFDAVSTNGSLLYLIEHRPPRGSENYRVRVYDFAADELRPDPVADKRNLETDMTGRPMARATSKDGIWVFTLYRGAKHAFVHALNVDQAYALCLDLPHGSGEGSGDWSLTLSEDGSTLRAQAGSRADQADFDLLEVLAE